MHLPLTDTLVTHHKCQENGLFYGKCQKKIPINTSNQERDDHINQGINQPNHALLRNLMVQVPNETCYTMAPKLSLVYLAKHYSVL